MKKMLMISAVLLFFFVGCEKEEITINDISYQVDGETIVQSTASHGGNAAYIERYDKENHLMGTFYLINAGKLSISTTTDSTMLKKEFSDDKLIIYYSDFESKNDPNLGYDPGYKYKSGYFNILHRDKKEGGILEAEFYAVFEHKSNPNIVRKIENGKLRMTIHYNSFIHAE